MWSQARHRMILDRLARDGRIAISDIVAETGVSRETARSDLVELEAQGIVLRRRGGAVLTDDPTARPEPNHLTRLSEALQEKEVIAALAVKLLPPRSSCFIDAGTTTAIFGRALVGRTDLDIVTNSLSIARCLSVEHNVTLLGGQPDADRQGVYGDLTLSLIQRYNLDFAVISPVAIDATAGLTNYAFAETAVATAMINHAAQAIVLAHSAKLGQRSRVQICPLDRIHILVSEASVVDQLDQACLDAVHLVCPPPGAASSNS